MFLSGIAGFIINSIMISTVFFEFKVNVDIKVYHETEAQFPAITVCNMSPIKQSAIEGNTQLQGVLGGARKKKRRRKRAVSEYDLKY